MGGDGSRAMGRYSLEGDAGGQGHSAAGSSHCCLLTLTPTASAAVRGLAPFHRATLYHHLPPFPSSLPQLTLAVFKAYTTRASRLPSRSLCASMAALKIAGQAGSM